MEAEDGTTSALSLPDPSVFIPLYGPGSADRFRAHAPFATGRSQSFRRMSTARLTSSDSPLGWGHARGTSRRHGVRIALSRAAAAERAFARGLADVLPAGDLTVVGNVGDDIEILGLHVSPDLDSLLYTLAGLIDEKRGWGRESESWNALASAAAGAATIGSGSGTETSGSTLSARKCWTTAFPFPASRLTWSNVRA